MLECKALVAACVLLLGSIHAMASEEFESPEGKTIEADGFKDAGTLSINGTKFEDSNRTAVFDIDERGLSGWVIRLKLDSREISNTTTDESGFYAFTNLGPGNYTVTEDQQAGWVQSFPGSGYYIINLDDKSAYKVNFGNFRLSNASRAPDPQNFPQKHPVMRITPEMIKREQEDYKKHMRDHSPD